MDEMQFVATLKYNFYLYTTVLTEEISFNRLLAAHLLLLSNNISISLFSQSISLPTCDYCFISYFPSWKKQEGGGMMDFNYLFSLAIGSCRYLIFAVLRDNIVAVVVVVLLWFECSRKKKS